MGLVGEGREGGFRCRFHLHPFEPTRRWKLDFQFDFGTPIRNFMYVVADIFIYFTFSNIAFLLFNNV